MILTNYLPSQGNGTFRLHAIATDKEGNTALLGTKTVTCDNTHATLPFGTIDTPAQGGQASGTNYINFGWVLTPQPNIIPPDGSTILVWVDGIPWGHPVYNVFRIDVATLFPGYANSNGAIGYYAIDTETLANGLHSIAWSVKDSASNVSGIGSRFFSVFDEGGSEADQVRFFDLASVQSHFPLTANNLAWLRAGSARAVFIRKGYDLNQAVEPIFPGTDGVIRIGIREAERLEVWLGQDFERMDRGDRARGIPPSSLIRSVSAESGFSGFSLVGDDLKPLPPGSFIDADAGIFFWQPGPGFIGPYDFIFVDKKSGVLLRLEVRISAKT
jgi:hypothetical protein